MENQRAVLEELLRDLLRAQSSVDSAVSNVGIAARTAERTPLGATFIDPLHRASDACAALRWQFEGHIAIVQAELARLPPAERVVLAHARHA